MSTMLKRFSILMFVVGMVLITACKRDVKVVLDENPSEEPRELIGEMDDAVVIEESSEGKESLVISADDELTVNVRSDYPPFMWEEEDGSFKGFWVDVEEAIFRKMGQNYRFIAYDDAGKAVHEVKTGEVHTAIAIPHTEDSEITFLMADYYIELSVVIFVHESNMDIGGGTPEECIESLYGKKVGVQARGFEYNLLRDHREIELVEYETGTVAMYRLNEQEVDAKIEVYEQGLYQKNLDGLDLKVAGVPIVVATAALGFNRDIDPEIIERYNAALAVIRENGTYDAIYDRWFSN